MPGDVIYDRPPVRIKACRHGTIIYFTADQFIGRSLDLYGEYCEGEIELFAQIIKPGMVVLDVGANIGPFTLYFAQAVGPSGRVHAFEPQRALHQMLCGTLALNGMANVRAVHGALGAKAGTILVPAIDYAQGGNFGALSLASVSPGSPGEDVGIATLDSLELERCDFIKIDVEGMEREVLEGATETLSRYKPFLYVENDREEKSSDLIAWLLTHDYRLFWHLTPLFSARNFFGVSENIFAPFSSLNMLAVPRSVEVHAQLHEILSPDDGWRNAVRLAQGLAACDRALAENPNDVAALGARALALHQQNRFAEALAGYDAAIARKADDFAVINNRGWLLQGLARHEEALAAYEKALAISPGHPIALANRDGLLQLMRQAAPARDGRRTAEP